MTSPPGGVDEIWKFHHGTLDADCDNFAATSGRGSPFHSLELYMSLADRIKFARMTAGLNQTELAKRAGIAQPTLHAIETGKSKHIRSATLFRLASALGQTTEWLIEGHGNAKETLVRSKEEQDLQEAFAKLSPAEKKIVLRIVRSLAIDK